MIQDDHIDLKIAELIDKYLRNDIHAEEMDVLEQWKTRDVAHQQLWDKLTNVHYTSNRLRQWPDDAQSEVLWQRVQQSVHVNARGKGMQKRVVWYAAASVVVMILAGWLIHTLTQQTEIPETFIVANDEEPVVEEAPSLVENPVASDDVTLIMGDGQTITLSDNLKSLQEQDGTQINSTNGGLEYTVGSRSGHLKTVMNTVITPVARTYHLILADGTRVWLSSASAIQYPTAFNGNERKVILKGEAYFEVEHNRDKPFIVMTEKSQITVLGTRFNVKSYPEDQMDRTALLGGSLRVASRMGERSTLLRPGYEAVVVDGEEMAVGKTDANKVLAWKNGLFVFDNESLESLLLELAKWYGIRVDFQDDEVKTYHFTGRLQRYQDIRFLLDIIAETSKVKFTFRNSTLSVSKVRS